MNKRINNLRDDCLGIMVGNLYVRKLMFDIHTRITYNLINQDFSRVLTLHQNFKRKDLIKEENRLYSITYKIAHALSILIIRICFSGKSILKLLKFQGIC